MAWTDPVRYPNSMEIADNEAFLNTYVIDNLAYLKANSGGIPTAQYASSTVAGTSLGTLASGSNTVEFALSSNIALKGGTESYAGTSNFVLSDGSKCRIGVTSSGIYRIDFSINLKSSSSLTDQAIGFQAENSTDGGTTWNKSTAYTSAYVHGFYLGTTSQPDAKILSGTLFTYCPALGLMRVSANTTGGSGTYNLYSVNFIYSKVA